MIEPMNRVTLLCSATQADRTLGVLQDLGAMHISRVPASGEEPAEEARTRLDKLSRILDALPEPPDGSSLAPDRPQELMDRIWPLLEQRGRLQSRRDDVSQEISRIRPFGHFDPKDLAFLENHGVFLTLWQASSEVSVPDNATRVVTSRDKEKVHFALFSRTQPEIQAHQVSPPRQSLGSLEHELTTVEGDILEIDQEIAGFAPARPVLVKHRLELLDRLDYALAKSRMEHVDPVSVLRGYVPDLAMGKLAKAASENGWGLSSTRPDREESPPTLLRHSRWFRPITAVFDMIGVVPGYWETDVSPFVLIFLSLFFGMIVGDAGYGLLFLGLTLAGRPLLRKAPSHLFPLMILMSASTMVWGLLTGNVFGLAQPPGPLDQLLVAWLSGQNSEANLMFFCFLLGGVHLTLGHAIRLIQLLPDLRAVAQLGWILITWVMFFAARTLVLMQPFPEAMFIMLPVGLVLVLGFMRPLRAMVANWTDYVRFPLDVISSFVDVVSYIRLFAVGTATFAVASAFNAMAADFGPFGILSGVAAGLILLLGHTLNILLAAMGVLVHGVRLNTLEFAGHAGIQWTGTLYAPFSRRARNISSSEPSDSETRRKPLDGE